jgi:hypothetical protein
MSKVGDTESIEPLSHPFTDNSGSDSAQLEAASNVRFDRGVKEQRFLKDNGETTTKVKWRITEVYVLASERQGASCRFSEASKCLK